MADFTWFFERGRLPLLVSMPHVGTQLPSAIAARLTPAALMLADTDWHLPRLYNFLGAMGANLLVAINSRYVIDLNRDPTGVPLYPGADNTELCPLSTAQREPVYLPGQAPDAGEIDERIATYWRPYHDKLAETLAEIKARHGYALLFDAHSIKSVLPRFFDGRLPDINLGTADQASADASIGPALLETALGYPAYSAVLNGRFKGGYITRHHGCPAQRVHAVQLELAWRTYMDEEGSFAFDEAGASAVRPALRAVIDRLVELGATLY
jgi:N-formylglutamate deformylase